MFGATFASAKKSCAVPWPDRSGDPNHRQYRYAIRAPAAATGTENAAALCMLRRHVPGAHDSHRAGITASGARFGRMRTAIAAATPAPTIRTAPRPWLRLLASVETSTQQRSHAAMAGTSLIG